MLSSSCARILFLGIFPQFLLLLGFGRLLCEPIELSLRTLHNLLPPLHVLIGNGLTSLLLGYVHRFDGSVDFI